MQTSATSDPAEVEDRPFSPSKRLVGILHSVVSPTVGFLAIGDPELAEGRAIGTQFVRDDHS